MTTPYTYILTFLPTNQIYYGVRYKEHCDPKELFVSYFSSSNVVKQLISEYGVDSFNAHVRKLFSNKKSARDWEQRVLIKMDASSHPNFLNQSNNMKGILRPVGLYTWCYNPTTNTKILVKKTNPIPNGFIMGIRGPDNKQKGKIIVTNITTGKTKKIVDIKDIPDDYIKGRRDKNGDKLGTTTNTKWICNDITGETNLIRATASIPDGWRYGNLHIKNAGKVAVHKHNPYKCINVDGALVGLYLADGWTLGNPTCRKGNIQIFKISNMQVTSLFTSSSEIDNYDTSVWYRGKPNMFRITFANGRVLTYPAQWFVINMNISIDMIRYAGSTGGQSKKYAFIKVDNLTKLLN